MRTCSHCGKEVPQFEGKRERRYCNDVCKQLAYRKRKQQTQTVNIQPVYDMTEGEELRAEVSDLAHTIELQQQESELRDQEIARLKKQLDFERRYLEDTKAYPFKAWLKKQPSSPGRDRFISEQLVPARGSRAMYEAHVRRLHCSDEEHQDFVRLWKLLLLQS